MHLVKVVCLTACMLHSVNFKYKYNPSWLYKFSRDNKLLAYTVADSSHDICSFGMSLCLCKGGKKNIVCMCV